MAHHKAFSKQCWSRLQKHEVAACYAMQKSEYVLSDVQENVRARYRSLMFKYAGNLDENSQILELGCGVVCLAQEFSQGKKTYLDPLLNDYRRACPGGLPKGIFLTDMAANVPQDGSHYDVILALRLLSYVENPELVLHEVERLLKPDGRFLISVETWPPLFARLHYHLAHIFPQWMLKERLYCYTCSGIEKSLERHFWVQTKQVLPKKRGFHLKQECFYVCNLLSSASVKDVEILK